MSEIKIQYDNCITCGKQSSTPTRITNTKYWFKCGECIRNNVIIKPGDSIGNRQFKSSYKH